MMRDIDERLRADLLARARAAAENAYAPYSQFPVGAAAMTSDGSFYSGCNVENASYGLTTCAERTAIGAAVTDGQREIVAVAVAAPRKLGTTPCGACRQVLSEFRPVASDMIVILDDGDQGSPVALADLLPQGFGPRELG
jgi:cytidine deaminase